VPLIDKLVGFSGEDMPAGDVGADQFVLMGAPGSAQEGKQCPREEVEGP
jgi:hypothetical protein